MNIKNIFETTTYSHYLPSLKTKTTWSYTSVTQMMGPDKGKSGQWPMTFFGMVKFTWPEHQGWRLSDLQRSGDQVWSRLKSPGFYSYVSEVGRFGGRFPEGLTNSAFNETNYVLVRLDHQRTHDLEDWTCKSNLLLSGYCSHPLFDVWIFLLEAKMEGQDHQQVWSSCSRTTMIHYDSKFTRKYTE